MIDIDIDGIFEYLSLRDSPVMEIELLRLITGERRIPSDKDDLFILHFSLYHALYRLKFRAGGDGYYLHLDPMRIRMIRIPGQGECRRYIPERGLFCGAPAGRGRHCALHAADEEDAARPAFDPLLDFYTNEENISFGRNPILEKLMKGAIVYSFRRGEIDRALAFFGVKRPDMKTIKRIYRELAKAYHPDKNGGDDSRMKELNHCYQVVSEVFVIP